MNPAEEVLAAARLMYSRGLVTGTVGNVSTRIGDTLLMTPTRRYYDELTVEALVNIVINPESRTVPPTEASMEWRLHTAIYIARPDVNAIAHTHSPHATARSFDPNPMEFITEERTYLGLDRVEVAELAPAGSPELARHAVHALGDRAACLLARHGVLAVGARPRDAVEVASAVEHQAVVHNTLRATNTTFKRNEDNNAIRI